MSFCSNIRQRRAEVKDRVKSACERNKEAVQDFVNSFLIF